MYLFKLSTHLSLLSFLNLLVYLDDLRKEIIVLRTYCLICCIFIAGDLKHFGILFAFLQVLLLALRPHAPFACEDALKANALCDGIDFRFQWCAFSTLLLHF